MRFIIKLSKCPGRLNDKKSHMFELWLDNGSSAFKTFDVTSAKGVQNLLADVNAAKQVIEDYLCANLDEQTAPE